MSTEFLLDVSTLEPCEPLQQILTTLPQLSNGDYIRVLHRMEPHPLYPLLAKQGYVWMMQMGKQTPIELFIWLQGDMQAELSVKKALLNS